MTIIRRFARCSRIIVGFGLLFVMSGMALGDDANRSPTEAERNAADALSRRGAKLFIDGEFHVGVVGFSSDVTLSDEDLANLAVFKQLGSFTFFSWNVTESGVAQLNGLNRLRRLTIPAGTKPEVVDKLKQVLPECRIALRPTRERLTGDTSTTLPLSGLRDPLMDTVMEVQTQLELQITDDQFARLLKLEADRSQWMSKANEAAPPTIESVGEKTRQEIERILNVEQFVRLRQVSLQREGVATIFRAKPLATELKLSDEQVTKMSRLYLAQLRELSGAKSTPSHDEAILAMLTPEQRQEWDKRIGAPRKDVTEFPVDVSAHMVFRYLDRDGNGQISISEWGRSRNVREAFLTAGIDISRPITHDTFRDQYVQVFGKRGEQK